MKQLNILAVQLNSGSITGGDGFTDVVAIITFVIFVNWYNSLFGVEAFQANPLPIINMIVNRCNIQVINHRDLNLKWLE